MKVGTPAPESIVCPGPNYCNRNHCNHKCGAAAAAFPLPLPLPPNNSVFFGTGDGCGRFQNSGALRQTLNSKTLIYSNYNYKDTHNNFKQPCHVGKTTSELLGQVDPYVKFWVDSETNQAPKGQSGVAATLMRGFPKSSGPCLECPCNTDHSIWGPFWAPRIMPTMMA